MSGCDRSSVQKAWLAAKDQFSDCLDDSASHILTRTTIHDALAAVDVLEREYAVTHKSDATKKALGSALYTISRLAPALDVFCQTEPMILCPIWGSVRLMCMVLTARLELFATVASAVQRVTEYLPRICAYAEMYNDSSTLQGILVRTFSNLIALFLQITEAVTKVDRHQSLSSDSTSFKSQLKTIVLRSTRRSLHTMSVTFNVNMENRIQTCIRQFQEDSSSIDAETRVMHHERAVRGWNQVEGLSSEVQSITDYQHFRELEEFRRAFLCWLAADDLTYQEDLNRASLSKDPGTCEWIQDSSSYKEFIESRRGSIFWLHGKPGCGKTIMFAALASVHLPQSYYYLFNNKTGTRSSNCFLAMLKGLVQQDYAKRRDIPECATVLRAAVAARIQQQGTEKELARVFMQLLQTGTDPVFVMVDALDEAEDAPKVVSWLQEITAEGNGRLIKAIVTSRRQLHLENQLRSARSLAMDPNTVDRDIERSIPFCIRQIASKHCITDSHKIDLIQQALSRDTNGLFLWVRMLTEYLASLPTVAEVMDSLDQFPENLTGLYMQILHQLVNTLSNNSARKRLASRIIAWLCFAKSNLTLAALGESVAIERDDTELVFDRIPTQLDNLLRELLGSFIEIVPGTKGCIVQFVHLSVKDFFLQDKVRCQVSSTLKPYFPIATHSNAAIAATLLRYLTFPSRAELREDRTVEHHDALFPYASLYWCFHFQNSGKRGMDLLPLIESLCTSKEGVRWLDSANVTTEDEGAWLVLIQSQLTCWNRSFGSTLVSGFLEEAVLQILKLACSQTEPDGIQYVERTYQLSIFLGASGKLDRATKLAEECQVILLGVEHIDPDKSRLLCWRITSMLGIMTVYNGHPIDALGLYTELLDRDEGGSEAVWKVKNRILEHTALIERGIGELIRAEADFKLAVDRWVALVGREDMHTMRAEQNLASVYDMQGRLGAAEELLQSVLTKVKSHLGDTHPNTLQSEHDLASVYEYRGKYAKAEAAYTHCLESRIKIIGEKNPRTLTTMHNLALVYEAQGRYQVAKALSEMVLHLRKEVLGELHGDTGRAYTSMASVHLALGDNEAASECINRALEIKQAMLKTRHQGGYTHPSIILTRNLEAALILQMGLPENALQLCDDLASSLEQALRVMADEDARWQHPSLLTCYHNKAIVCCKLGLYPEARALYWQAYEGRKRTLGENHVLTIRSLGNLAWATLQAGHGGAQCLQDVKVLCAQARRSSLMLERAVNGQPGIEYLDKGIVLHNECYIDETLSPDGGPSQHREILKAVLALLEGQGSHIIQARSTESLLQRLHTKEMVLDDRWERHRDIR
ncbi:hypothetical protein PG984_016331 [Apiospora sp. TS-2023a]